MFLELWIYLYIVLGSWVGYSWLCFAIYFKLSCWFDIWPDCAWGWQDFSLLAFALLIVYFVGVCDLYL